MKWPVLALMAFASVALPGWLRRNPSGLQIIGFLIGFCPFFLGWYHLNMAIISWADWPGYVKGVEVSIVDFLIVAVYFTLPRTIRPFPLLLTFTMAAYFFAALLSILQSGVPITSFFYCWQLLKLYFLCSVLARACATPEFADAVLKGLGVAVIVEAFFAGSQHFALGVPQAPGTMSSQNELGMVTNLVAIPFFAVLLSGRTGWLAGVVVASAVVIEISTGSRATVGLGASGYALVIFLSLLRRWTSRKGSIVLVGMAVAIVGGVAASASIGHRTASAFESSDEERLTFEKVAAMMLTDHPFGVGANEYVVVANTQGYNNRAGVNPTAGSEGANVHNVYRLVAAETGYLGLLTYALLLVSSAVFVLSRGWRFPATDQRGDLIIGIGVSFCILYLHSFYEWIFITFQVQYVYCILLALAVGVSNQLGYLPRSKTEPARGSWSRLKTSPHFSQC